MVLLLAAHARADDDGVYTITTALREWHDLSLLAKPAEPARGYGQTSSWDRNFANYDQGNFLRENGEEMIMLDVRGPGVLTRLWTAEPMGVLRFYFDGATEPQLTFLWSDLRQGKVAPFTEPFLSTRGGGCVLRFPLPFEKGLKVTLSGQTWCHWQADYQYFTAGTKVQTWMPEMVVKGFAEELAAAAEAWNHPAGAVAPGTVTIEKQLALSAERTTLALDVPAGALITEITFEQANGKMIPGALELVYGDARIPWRALAGVWESEDDSESLLQGRRGTTSYFRVPFTIPTTNHLSFQWNAAAAGQGDTEALGIVRVRTMDGTGLKFPPQLFINRSVQKVGEGKFFSAREEDAAGRLLIVGAHVSMALKADYMEGDNTIFIDGEKIPALHGTGFEDFFDSAWYFEKGTFATAVAGSPVQKEGLRTCAARVALWPAGLPFHRSLQLDWEAGAQNEAGKSIHDIFMVGQCFSDVAEPANKVVHVATTDHARIGMREANTEGLGYVQYTDPLTAESQPKEAWIDVHDDVLSGTLAVDVAADGLQKILVALDLPLGWKGMLSGANETKEVFDLGWPWIEIAQPKKGEIKFDWSLIPPNSLQGGDVVAQLRVEATLPGGAVQTLRRVVRITTAPRGTAEVEIPRDAITRDGDRYLFHLPGNFEGKPGDQIVLDAQVNVFDGARDEFAKLEFDPVGKKNLSDGSLPETGPLIAKDGETMGRARLRGVRHSITFPVGRFASWAGHPREIRISLPGHALDLLQIHGAKLYRQYEPPKPEGWSRRVPLEEAAPGQYQMPHAAVTLVGRSLREAIRLVVATPQDQINPELRRAAFLENVEAGPLKWRFADEARRPALLSELPSFVFPARRTGERIAIHDSRFVGKRFFGIQFGYDPMSGIVGVRDCEGRLAAVDSLYMNKPATFPRFLWVALPKESRDGWIYLEALGLPPGSFEQRISIQRVMAFNEDDPAKLFP